MIKTWEILETFKKTNNNLYYINLKFYCHYLCDDHSSKATSNFLQYNNSYFILFSQIKSILDSISMILEKKKLLTVEELINFSNQVKNFQSKGKKHYDILTLTTNSLLKDDYQRILFRIIIEGILNKPISKNDNNCIITEDFAGYEEMLERQYATSHQLIMRIQLNNLDTKNYQSR